METKGDSNGNPNGPTIETFFFVLAGPLIHSPYESEVYILDFAAAACYKCVRSGRVFVFCSGQGRRVRF